MHQLCGYAASLSICLQINIEIRVAIKGGLCHCFFDDIRHLQETTLSLAEAGIYYLIGSIHDARHIATLLDGIKGKLQTLELLVIRLKELQVLSLEEVETVAIEMQAQWEARLKDGVTAEDCRTVFVCAAAWMAVVGIYTQKSVTGWNIESFTVGDVSVKTTGLENTSQMSAPQKLEWQARMLMRPFCRPEGFAFVGVRG